MSLDNHQPRTRAVSVGCWLPSLRSGFFHFDEDMDLVIGRNYRYDLPLSSGGPLPLDCSIYRRLSLTLAHWGYTGVYPVYNRYPGGGLDGALFVGQQRLGKGLLENAEVLKVILSVDADGFDVLTALYDDNNVLAENIADFLTTHLQELVGGDFFSHEMGSDDTSSLQASQVPATLQQYRDVPLGILTFSQINTIMEGLYNSAMDFNVFFSGKVGAEDQDSESAKRKYSLGGFVQAISVDINHDHHPEQVLDSPFVQLASELVLDVHGHAHAAGYLGKVMDAGNKARMLHGFLTVTQAISLRQLKQRIERCRRALLATMIQVTQRRERLAQVESPDNRNDPLNGVNEDQLRGFLLLIAAKLPLISNVHMYVKELVSLHHVGSGSPPTELLPALRSWSILLESIYGDMDGLSKALGQAWSDRMLNEEEQIHTEEETLAEIERIREQTSPSFSPLSGITVNLMSNIFALLAVALTALSLTQTGLPQVTYPDILTWQNLLVLGEVVGAAAGLSLVYFLLHVLVQLILRWILQLSGHYQRHNEPYYYEMDIRLDVPVEANYARDLLNADFTQSSQGLQSAESSSGTKTGKSSLLGFKPWPRRSSYRVERNSKDEATHKIYIEADLYLNRPTRWRKRGRTIHTVFVYELLFHRPSLEHGYVFKDMRAVATSKSQLRASDLEVMKEVVAKQFINRWIADEEDKLQTTATVRRPIDALLTVNVIKG